MTAKKMAQWVYSETKDSQVEKLIKQLSKHKDKVSTMLKTEDGRNVSTKQKTIRG